MTLKNAIADSGRWTPVKDRWRAGQLFDEMDLAVAFRLKFGNRSLTLQNASLSASLPILGQPLSDVALASPLDPIRLHYQTH